MKQLMSKIGLAVTLAGAAAIARADWSLDNNASTFHYVTSKNATVSEVNSIAGLSGAISDNGMATLRLNLATVDTAVEVRDQRMRDIVFQVEQFPEATISVPVDSGALDDLKPGVPATATYPVTVSLHGMTQEMPADLQVVKLTNTTLQVNLVKPLIVSAASFGLAEGVEELRALAGLNSITPSVVVDFSLLYRK
ncbi:MAG: YceI family protein [Pseudomonadales bacterium]|jgi:polyisoprenoid-binding protein YceI|nr:YceI family protein [Pseudomonadales bacterium]